MFRETLAKLEEEAKEERNRLKTEHANCIQMNIDKQKRDAMLGYLFAVEEKPHSIKNIIKAARKFFQVCEHDRLHRYVVHVFNPLKRIRIWYSVRRGNTRIGVVDCTTV